MKPENYFYAICIVLSILTFTFAAFQFIFKAKPVIAISEFTRHR